MSFTDYQVVLPALSRQLPLNQTAVTAAIGTVDPMKSLEVQRRYLVAFFTQHLLGIPQPVLDEVPADLKVAELIR